MCDVLRYETDARVWLEIVSDWNVFLPFFFVSFGEHYTQSGTWPSSVRTSRSPHTTPSLGTSSPGSMDGV